MIKKLLFVLSALLLSLNLAFADGKESIPFDGSDPIADSIYMQERMKLLNREYGDSIEIFTHSSIHYSPDSLLKIFIWEGESCGMYCNPIFESEIHCQSQANGLNIHKAELASLKDIILIEGDEYGSRYLIIQEYWSRPFSYRSDKNISINIIELYNQEIHSIPIQNEGVESHFFDFANAEEGRFSIYSPHWFEDTATNMKWDSKTKELSYSACVEGESASATASADKGEGEQEYGTLIEGKLRWRTDHFVLSSEIQYPNQCRIER